MDTLQRMNKENMKEGFEHESKRKKPKRETKIIMGARG
jgi:hypothetical protein